VPGEHFSVLLSEEEIARLLDGELDELAHRMARRAFHPLCEEEGEEAQRADALAYLHLLAHLRDSVERLSDRAAEQAARAGAGYPQLGRACSISRQGARRRWPGLVGADPHPPAPDSNRSR
jgi:hypothetical protein